MFDDLTSGDTLGPDPLTELGRGGEATLGFTFWGRLVFGADAIPFYVP